MPKAPAKKTATSRVSSRELIFGDLWEFDPAPETADPKLKKRYDLFIGLSSHLAIRRASPLLFR